MILPVCERFETCVIIHQIVLDALSWAPDLDKENYNRCTSTCLSVLRYRMTFWPRFVNSRNNFGNWVELKDIFISRPAPSADYQGSSCGQNGWRGNICETMPRCLKTHSKTPSDLYLND